MIRRAFGISAAVLLLAVVAIPADRSGELGWLTPPGARYERAPAPACGTSPDGPHRSGPLLALASPYCPHFILV